MDEAAERELDRLLHELVVADDAPTRAQVLEGIRAYAADPAWTESPARPRRLVLAMADERESERERLRAVDWPLAVAYREPLWPVRAQVSRELRALVDSGRAHSGAKVVALDLLDDQIEPADAVRLRALALSPQATGAVLAAAAVLWHRLAPAEFGPEASRLLYRHLARWALEAIRALPGGSGRVYLASLMPAVNPLSGRLVASRTRMVMEALGPAAQPALRHLHVLARTGSDLVPPAITLAMRPGFSLLQATGVVELLRAVGPEALLMLRQMALTDADAKRRHLARDILQVIDPDATPVALRPVDRGLSRVKPSGNADLGLSAAEGGPDD